jgi:type VI secretion system protein ImpL
MILGWISGRGALGAAAWAALSLVVWYAGDALTLAGGRPLEQPTHRVATIAAIAIAWLIWEMLRVRRLARENARLLDGLIGDSIGVDSSARAAHEAAVLQKRFEDAMQTLRRARFRSGAGEPVTVRELPWYMFIGAPGSGKTTALLNAGLRFPLGETGAERTLQGVGGTRNCDWLFTDEAVLLDTAGRYTTQESDKQADAAAWLAFLELLKRYRPQRPLNGAVVTLSISDLVHWSDEELARYAAHVRERVWELYTRLGVRLPIYLLVTKADLLAGFSEFFSDLDTTGRGQVWGTTFEFAEPGIEPRVLRERLEQELASLESRIYDLLPGRLQADRDLQRRAAIYRFPQQFKGTTPLVVSFVDAAFGAAWGGEPPLLRGVYFTSGTQEGSPIDRVMATLARSFNLERKVQPPVLGTGKSYFLKRLLREVIFSEAGVAGTEQALERRARFARAMAYAAMALVTVALAAVWSASYFANRALVAAAAERTGALERAVAALPAIRDGDEAKLVALLNELRGLRATEGGAATATWALHAGFYQGDKLAAQADRAYRKALQESLLEHLAASLEQAARGGDRQVLEGLRALRQSGRRDAHAVEEAALRVWRLPQATQADLLVHLRAGLSET